MQPKMQTKNKYAQQSGTHNTKQKTTPNEQSERANRERLQRLVALGDGHVAADARWKQPRLNQYFMGDATREERRTGVRVAAASLQPNVDGLDGQVEVGLQ